MTSCFRVLSLSLFVVLTACCAGQTLADPALDDAAVAARAEALLKQMTLDEKVGQMTQVDLAAITKDMSHIEKYFIGSILSGAGGDPPDNYPASWRKTYDECQSWALKTRLKIPMIYGIDSVHGHNNVIGAVIFPHNIAMGATRNPALVEKEERATAEEMRATGITWAFAPCVTVVQNERWGRTYESFGEDPALVAQMATPAVRGFQGKNLADPTSVVACAKHFVGDGGTTDGIDRGNTECDEPTLRRIHLPGYLAAIKAGVGTIMVSFSSWNGTPMHAHKYLLTDVLKGELGFQGFLISDWAAIDLMGEDYKKDIEQSINAGLDMIMIPFAPGEKNNYVEFVTKLKELVAEGKVPQSRIDDAVRRILRIKIKSGLFEHPMADPAMMKLFGCAEHREVARECVRQSLVLLKNEKQALPLAKDIKRLVVVGKAADDIGIQCGGWTIDWQGTLGKQIEGGTTILAAVRKTVAPGTEVVFSPDGADTKGASAVLVVLGEKPYAEMEGDRKDLSLPAEDVALVGRAKESGAPVITVLVSGRPLLLGKALDASDAFVEAWQPGTEGLGVTDVLFGDYKPTGKLPITWPKSMDQIPPRGVHASTESPQFPYGFGLSY